MVETQVFTLKNITEPSAESENKTAACIAEGVNETRIFGWCPRDYDFVLCWPPTPPATYAELPCLGELHGIKYDTSQNASRWCDETGTWANYSDYTFCNDHIEVIQPDMANDWNVIILSLIYLAGYGISLIALAIAVTIFIYYKDLRCLRNTVHTNLMVSYILADFMWILHYVVMVVFGATDRTLGIVLVIPYQYFYLTNFFWMFVEGLYLYMLVVETFTRENIKLKGYLIIGWGIPAPFTITWSIIRFLFPPTNMSHQNITEPIRQTEEDVLLWIDVSNHDWVNTAPAIIVLVLNFIFLIAIMWVLITKLRSANNVETHQNRKATKALLVLIPLLGSNYVLFLFGPTEKDSIHQFLYQSGRALLLSTQGFTVALFYCFLNTEVRNTVRHHFHTWKESRTLGKRYTFSKDWSPSTRTESLRLFNQGLNGKRGGRKKRGSSVSEATTMTTVGGSSRVSNGSVGVKQIPEL